MANTLPYLASPGSIKTALDKIRAAATPDRVTGDFMSTKLDMKGGAGKAIIPFLKKIGFVNSDGTPSELYRNFRNPSSGGAAVANAIKLGYRSLASVNEYFYELKDPELLALIIQVTGAEADNSTARLTLSTLKNLKSFAKFGGGDVEKLPANPDPPIRSEDKTHTPNPQQGDIGLNLAYTINLNLPATTDQAVFNAIFRSLKEHLLSYGKE